MPKTRRSPASSSASVEKRRYPCSDCEFSTQIKRKLKEHRTNVHEEKKYDCHYPGCKFASSIGDHLETHISTHTMEKLHNCTFCNYSAGTKKCLKAHIASWHPANDDLIFKCPDCAYVGSTKRMFDDHVSNPTLLKVPSSASNATIKPTS